jgi:hypothetical protein
MFSNINNTTDLKYVHQLSAQQKNEITSLLSLSPEECKECFERVLKNLPGYVDLSTQYRRFQDKSKKNKGKKLKNLRSKRKEPEKCIDRPLDEELEIKIQDLKQKYTYHKKIIDKQNCKKIP